MNLKNIIPAGNYSGIATFSDVHAHAKKLKKGIKYALKNNLFIVFLGDLVDGHNKPLETVSRHNRQNRTYYHRGYAIFQRQPSGNRPYLAPSLMTGTRTITRMWLLN